MKKRYIELKQVSEFFLEATIENRAEYYKIIEELENTGRLSPPFGEKVESNLFAVRIITTGNIRVFYTYGLKDKVYGIFAYRKKTQKIPLAKLKHARKILKILSSEKMI